MKRGIAKKGMAFAAAIAMVLVTIVQPVSAAAMSTIWKATPDKTELSSDGGVVTFTLGGEELVEGDTACRIKKDGVVQTDIPVTITGTGERQTVAVTFPANAGTEDVTYRVDFHPDNSEQDMDKMYWSDKKVDILIKAPGSTTEPTDPPADPGEIYVVNVDKTSLENEGGTVEFTLLGSKMDSSMIRTKVVRGEVRDSEIEATAQVSGDKDGQKTVTLTFPKNTESTEKTYEVSFNASGSDTDFMDDLKKSITVAAGDGGGTPQPPVEVDTGVTFVQASSKNLETEGGRVTFTVYGKDMAADKMRVKVEAGQVRQPEIEKTFAAVGEGTAKKQTVTLDFPKNETSEDQVYQVSFNAIGSDTDFYTEKDMNITVKAKEGGAPEDEMKINELTIRTPELPSEGGRTSVTVKGEALDSSKMNLKVVRIVGVDEVDQPQIYQNAEFAGLATLQTASLSFPANPETEKAIYKISVGSGLNYKEGFVYVGGDAATGEIVKIYPASVSVNNAGNLITLRFSEDISDATNGRLNEFIALNLYGTGFVDLSDEDVVTVEDREIRIALDQAVAVGDHAKIQFRERAIQDQEGRLSAAFEWDMKQGASAAYKAEIIEGETLTAAGGETVVRLTGENLGTSTVARVLDTTTNDAEKSIPVTVSGEGEEQILTYTVPANQTDRTKTYMMQLSLDGGNLYSTIIGIDELSRTQRIVTAVLPEGVDAQQPTLSYMTITSYGTSGGTEWGVDTTHTNLPTGQESKKTYVRVYGTNLDQTKTKVKIVDEDGITWPIYNDPSSDSMDNFIMVGFNGTGIEGNGNYQALEIICPRNIKGDRTYTYLIAVDGVNFDQEVTVSATVLDDGETGKHDPDREKGEITVQYVKENGESLADDQVYLAYQWFKLSDIGIEVKAFDGYQLKEQPDLTGTVGTGARTITLVYEEVKTPVDPDGGGQNPDGEQPDGQNPGTQNPDGQNPNTHNPDTQTGAAGQNGQNAKAKAAKTGDASHAAGAAVVMLICLGAAVKARRFR